ncbi:rhamnogalacturonan acetylesterase [Sphingobium sp. Leaf26]|uniref:rhamnogalacturonan acetylesterase n=1 Tax=Sphingobium sp. Leaf26 TaxID=1735693 RepID=UPI0006FCAA41|nr:rhamnogalacturonan acetylesterase [Sphingobium sp. Leaf26]KQM99329.1 rhamnogalacturonan acetylesterase [Sphingobium sp. Leaf26]
MPISAALVLMLSVTPLMATHSFDLRPESAERQRPYEAGGHGVEPGGSADGFLYSVALPQGDYRVTLTLGGNRAGETTVKAEARRLMLSHVRTRRGETVERSFLVNVRTPALTPPPANAPGGKAVRIDARDGQEFTWDEKLTLEFLGRPAVRSVRIEPVHAPTIFLAGDSTVTDQYAEPAASWGQMLPAMLDDRVVVANHAKSGATLKSFLTDLRFDKLLSGMKAGDWLFIQFGHNDQKAEWPQTYADPDVTYPAYLRAYIAEARRRGAQPVLVTSPERRNFDAAGRIKDTLGAYAAAVRTVAAEDGVPLIDLNADSRAIYESLGPERAPAIFNDGGKDRTHHNDAGAWLLARAVAERIRAQVPTLAGHVTAPAFVPGRPQLETVAIVPSLIRSDQRPAGN